MNKDVIYIEPEDDITDIISKLKSSKEKVVALVPPKNIGILRSAVNTKLIARAAKQSEKVAVVVTADTSLTKLAVNAGLPIAKTLQSRPKLSEEFEPEDLANSAEPISIDERKLDNKPAKKPVEEIEAPDEPEEPESAPKTAKTEKKPAKKAPDDEFNSSDLEKKDKKKSKKGKKGIPDFDKYRKFIVIGVIAGILLIVFLIWAILFAPAATIAVKIRTTANNFSEGITLTTDQNSEDTENGVFYLETQEEKKENSVEFTATGKKDVGEKATGSLYVSATLTISQQSISIPKGASFTYGGYTYYADNASSLVQEGSSCSQVSAFENTCKASATISVTAAENGEEYNIGAQSSGWTSSVSGLTSIYNQSAFTGGSSKTVTYVQQSDVDEAQSKLEDSSEEYSKEQLIEAFGDDIMVIEASYTEETGKVTSSPAVGKEVEDGEKAKLTITSTYTIYGVEKSKINEFITKKTEEGLADDQKLYETGDPFIERFTGSNGSFTGRLKSTTQTGPKVTEEDVLEKVKGKKVGEVQTLLRSINGVSSVDVDTSFFWVNSVPDDANKIKIEITMEE